MPDPLAEKFIDKVLLSHRKAVDERRHQREQDEANAPLPEQAVALLGETAKEPAVVKILRENVDPVVAAAKALRMRLRS